MAVTFEIDADTPDRELAAIACLIAVLRGDTEIPRPPRVLFDYSDNPLEERPGAAAPAHAASAPPPPAPAPAAPPPPAPPTADPPASETLLQQEAARAEGAGAGSLELDINGIPWDEKIHAGTKVKNQDGSWRLKRGVDPALVESVTAGLKAAAAGMQQQAGAGAPPPPTEGEAPPAVDAATAFGAGGADNASDAPGAGAPPPPAADAAPPPPVPPAPPAEGELTYPQIIARANEAGLSYEALNGLAADLGLEKFASLTKRPDLFRLFADAMEAKIAEGPAA